jgi:replicative DNA helicase
MPESDWETALAPVDIDAELHVCGSLLMDRSAISDTMALLNPEHFHSLRARYIYEAICGLYLDGAPVTTETVGTVLRTKSELGKTRLELIGGNSSIVETFEGLGEGECDYWARIVRNKYDERQLLQFGNEVRQAALSSPTDLKALRTRLEEKLVSLSGVSSSSSVSIGQASGELDARIQRYIDNPADIVGMATGLERLDRELDGLQGGNVTIVYAPSSRYKSLVVTNIGRNLAEQAYPGLWFTTEMPRVQVMERCLQLEAGLNLKWLRRDKNVYQYRKQIREAQDRLASYPIYFCDTSALDVSEVRAEVSRHVRWNDIKYIIVDLVDHISSSRYKDEMTNNQRMVMSSMKQIAKDFDVHVILVSHITKQPREMRNQPDLDVESMAGSGAKYQDVDAAISVGPVKKEFNELGEFRWVAMDRADIQHTMQSTGIIELMVAITKNRHGELTREIYELDFHHGGKLGLFSKRTQ